MTKMARRDSEDKREESEEPSKQPKCLHIFFFYTYHFYNLIHYSCWPNQPQRVIVEIVDRQRDIFDILSFE